MLHLQKLMTYCIYKNLFNINFLIQKNKNKNKNKKNKTNQKKEKKKEQEEVWLLL